jgi:hypothetical protein
MLFHIASISILDFAAAICSDVSLHISTLDNAEVGSTITVPSSITHQTQAKIVGFVPIVIVLVMRLPLIQCPQQQQQGIYSESITLAK